jgi:hypothetical protein
MRINVLIAVAGLVVANRAAAQITQGLARAERPSGGPARLPQAVPRVRDAGRPRLRPRFLCAGADDARS